MRIYTDCKKLISEITRDVYEQGITVKPKTYQNKDIEGNLDYETKELMMYSYCLTSLENEDVLYMADPRSKKWVEEELRERLYNESVSQRINPGEAWKIRPELWAQFRGETGFFDYTYNERMRKAFLKRNGSTNPQYTDNLIEVIQKLKEDPDTRKAILPIFSIDDVQFIDGSRRIPCSMYYNFLIRDNKLHIIYHQRSADVITHIGNDVALSFKLMQWVAYQVGVSQGYLYHTIDSLHCYRKDWPKLKEIANQL